MIPLVLLTRVVPWWESPGPGRNFVNPSTLSLAWQTECNEPAPGCYSCQVTRASKGLGPTVGCQKCMPQSLLVGGEISSSYCSTFLSSRTLNSLQLFCYGRINRPSSTRLLWWENTSAMVRKSFRCPALTVLLITLLLKGASKGCLHKTTLAYLLGNTY